MKSARVQIGALIATLAVVATAACSSSGSGQASQSSSAAETRTVEDTLNGDISGVPTAPKRIIGLWRTGSLLADMGVTPVGILADEFSAEELGQDLYAKVADVPTVGTFDGVDIEKVIALKPDLIVGMDNGGITIDYKQLQQVAPTVILKIAEPTDVWDNYPRLAELAGQQTDFLSKNAALEQKLKSVATEYGSKVKDLKVTSFGAFDDTIYVDTSKSLTVRRLTAAGFGYNKTYTTNPERYTAELSTENIADLADQDIIFYDANLDGTPTAGTEKILGLASFKQLPAAKAGNVFPLCSGTIYTFPAGDNQVRDMKAAAQKYAAPAGDAP